MHLVTNVTTKGDSPALLRHWLDYYRRAGVETFHVFFNHYEDEGAILPVFEQLFASADIHVVMTYLGVEDMQLRVDRISDFRRDELGHHAYVLNADSDEFIARPRRVLELLDKGGYDYVVGRLVDRLALDGKTPEIRDDTDVFADFPLCSYFSYEAMGATITKVPISRPGIRHRVGLHRIESPELYRQPGWEIPVHHLKWQGSVIPRIRERVARGYGGDKYLQECRFLLENYVLDDQTLDLREIECWFDDRSPDLPAA